MEFHNVEHSIDVLYAGLDIGSITVKIMVLNQKGYDVYFHYERHQSDIKKSVQCFTKHVESFS